MEILFSILCAIFAVLASVFGVRRSTRLGTRGGIRDEGGRYTDLVSDNKRLERDKERVEELDARGADKLRECSRIGERIRKREPEADISE